MAYDARTIQILIASPGDVTEEREIIAEVIYEWNYVNSRQQSIVLLPLRWETHTFPEIGREPQSVINKQIVDSCDMAVAVFWTRLGTPTSVAESGTAEELSRVADAGKRVMLYFSRGKVDLQSVDLKEYARLTDFKTKLFHKALVENYSSPNEFRDTFRRQLAMCIRDLIAEDSMQHNKSGIENERILLALAEGDPPHLLDSPGTLEITHLNCIDRDDTPDYVSSYIPLSSKNQAFSAGYTVIGSDNKDYYRQMVDYQCEASQRNNFWLALTGSSEQGVRDIHLEIRAHSRNQAISINPPKLSVPSAVESTVQGNVFFNSGFAYNQGPAAIGMLTVGKTSKDEWRLETDIPIVQARRTVLSSEPFVLKAAETGTVTFETTVYSSDALPFSLGNELRVVVKSLDISYKDILKQIIPGSGQDEDSQISSPDA